MRACPHLAHVLHNIQRAKNPVSKMTFIGDQKKMSTIDQTRLLQLRSHILDQNSALLRAAGRNEGATSSEIDGVQAGFGQSLTEALHRVSDQQARSSDLSAAYERGDTQDIVQVMVERQKASLGFEATLQVRNKLLSAYRDIMNMPV
jgi:flagellar hook-basal body complex protein FliE